MIWFYIIQQMNEKDVYFSLGFYSFAVLTYIVCRQRIDRFNVYQLRLYLILNFLQLCCTYLFKNFFNKNIINKLITCVGFFWINIMSRESVVMVCSYTMYVCITILIQIGYIFSMVPQSFRVIISFYITTQYILFACIYSTNTEKTLCLQI